LDHLLTLQDSDFPLWEQQDVGAEDPRDGPRCSKVWDARSRVNRQLRESRSKPAKQVEDRELDVPEPVFHIVTEDPQIEHVATQVKPPDVHEHGSDECQGLPEGVGKEAARDESPLLNEGVTPSQFYNEEQDVQSDQGIRDQGNGSARGIIIANWQHEIHLLLL
jgi:hypothetical protein